MPNLTLNRMAQRCDNVAFTRPLCAFGLQLALLVICNEALAATCTVASLSSPVFAPYQGVTITSTGSITVNCTSLIAENVSYNIRIGPGAQSVGTQRRMVLGTNFLNYNFFCTATFNQVWADGLGGTCATSGGGSVQALSPLMNTEIIYGRIPPVGQLVTAGAYSDTVTVDVLYLCQCSAVDKRLIGEAKAVPMSARLRVS